jgi:hypothetical protein
MSRSRYLLICSLVALAAVLRLFPYILRALGEGTVSTFASSLWNFSPMGAICLFAGAQLTGRRDAWLVPFITLLVSDLAIGLLMSDTSYAFYPGMPVVYACFLVMILLGAWQRGRGTGAGRWGFVAAAGLAGELCFFLATNFAAWVELDSFYTRDLSGLVDCYVAALPFFRHSLAGMAVYGTALFGGLALIESGFPELREQAAG